MYIKAALYRLLSFCEEKEDEEYLRFSEVFIKMNCMLLLTIVDPKACETIHPNNVRRIIRAFDDGAQRSEKKRTDRIAAACFYYMIRFIIGLTMPRTSLYERIDQRVDLMMKRRSAG